MDLATGAMASLLPKLAELLHEEYKLQTGVRKDVEFLEREMRSMDAALRKVARVPRDQLDQQVKIWADNVRELSYEMEDVVDSFLVRVEGSDPAADPHRFKGLMKKMTNLFKKGKTRHQIAGAITDIKDQVQEVSARRDRYKVDDAAANPTTSTATDPRITALLKDQRELVGIDEPRDELIKRLTCDSDGVPNSNQELKILSISGFGGLGKTTLAKAIYDKLHGEFIRKAFVSVGQNPNLKKAVIAILLQLDEASCLNATMLDEVQLIQKLRGLLENKRYAPSVDEFFFPSRYLIVIDDIWNTDLWKIIKYAWVDNRCGSVIITTTRIHKVAKETTDHVYEHRPLLDDKSRELFYKRLSIGKGKNSYDQMAELSEKILQKCGGVPLAIITIASVLASKPRECWSEVYNSIGFEHGKDTHVDNTRKILLYSYYDLPCHLRTCLLYLGIFQEDYEIMKDNLIWKWVAEGFVHEKPAGIGLFEQGEIYFNELINRSMIQPVEDPYKFGTIHACRVHDLMLDMICSLSKQENFVVVLGSDDQHTCPEINARRLAVQKRLIGKNDPLANTPMPQVRSFNATNCHVGTMTWLSSFHVLRVLALGGCIFLEDHPYHLEHMGKLLQLRYLGLSGTPVTELPSDIGNLKFLQILHLKNTRISELPPSVGLLRQLKCLDISECSSFSGDLYRIGNLTSLEELVLDKASVELVKELAMGKLTELRVLSIGFRRSNAELLNDLMECLGKLQKLQVIWLLSWPHRVSWDDCESGCVVARHLRDLTMAVVNFSRLPAWIDPLHLPLLCRLRLSVMTMEAEDVGILGSFPELVALELQVFYDDAKFPNIVGGGAFPKLRYFQVETALRFLQGAMPSLEFLVFSLDSYDSNASRFETDIATIENLPCLQKIRVSFRGDDMDEAVLRDAVALHPRRPTLEIEQFDY